MIQINNTQLHRFKKMHCEYLYMVSKGIYLAFDIKSLEYIGIEMMYLPHNYISVNKECDNKINELISKDILILV